MNNKKAVSAVIATSLIVLITVAAVAILWTAVMPIIRNSVPGTDDCMGVTPNTEIISACISGGNLKLTVKQTSDSTIGNLKVIRYDANGVATFSTEAALVKNIEQIYTVTGSAASVAVAPIVNGKECDSTAKKTVVATCA